MITSTIASATSAPWALGWSAVSAAASVVGLIGILLAVVNYMHSVRGAERAHLHATFRAYLDARLVHIRDSKREEANSAMLALKLYTLEEMLGWLARAQKGIWPSVTRSQADGWRCSIAWHLREDHDKTLESLLKYPNCYSDILLRFASAELGAPELNAWVAQGRKLEKLPIQCGAASTDDFA